MVWKWVVCHWSVYLNNGIDIYIFSSMFNKFCSIIYNIIVNNLYIKCLHMLPIIFLTFKSLLFCFVFVLIITVHNVPQTASTLIEVCFDSFQKCFPIPRAIIKLFHRSLGYLSITLLYYTHSIIWPPKSAV